MGLSSKGAGRFSYPVSRESIEATVVQISGTILRSSRMSPPQTTNARTTREGGFFSLRISCWFEGSKDIPTQLAEMGDLVVCLGLDTAGPFPRLAASFFANRSFARRCWGVCVYAVGLVLVVSAGEGNNYHGGCSGGRATLRDHGLRLSGCYRRSPAEAKTTEKATLFPSTTELFEPPVDFVTMPLVA